MLDSHGDLAIAELAFFVPAFLIALVVNFKQGLSRNLGWLYLLILPILQIIGAACTLYIETQSYSAKVEKAGIITMTIGTAPLLLVLLGFLERINKNMAEGRGFSQWVFHVVHLVPILGLILAIVGGVDESGNDPSKKNKGKDCLEAGSILFAAAYLAIALSTVLSALKRSYIAQIDYKLVIAGLCVLPFLLVKIAYTVAISFSNPGSIFYFLSPNVWVQAFMNFLMIAICLIIYIAAGLLAPKNTAVQAWQPENGYTPQK